MIIDLFLVLGSTEDLAKMTSQAILGLIFRLEGGDSHASEHWGWANLNEALRLVLLEGQVLGFDPAH